MVLIKCTSPLFLALAVSCNLPNQTSVTQRNDSKLTRPVASKLLEKTRNKRTFTALQLSQRGIELGIEDGLWTAGEDLLSTRHLTPKGRQLFKSLPWYSDTVTLHDQFEIRIDGVTGIADGSGITNAFLGQGIKEVQFSWGYLNLPSVIRRYASLPGG